MLIIPSSSIPDVITSEAMASAEFVFEVCRAEVVLTALRVSLPDEAACAELGVAEAFQITDSPGYDLKLSESNVYLSFRRNEDGRTFGAKLSVGKISGDGAYNAARAALLFAASVGDGKQLSETVHMFLRALLGNTGRPYFDELLACTPEHLTTCPECREAFENFVGKTWDAPLRGWEVPAGFADISLLSRRAKVYFTPAYALAATANRDTGLLDLTELAFVSSTGPLSSCTLIPETLGAALRLVRFAIVNVERLPSI